MEVLNVFTAFGLSASAGLNAYIPLLVIAFLAKFTTLIKLQTPWDTLTSWWIIGILIFLSIIEFFADKVPAVNHINDLIQTFVRPAAGAIAFAASAHVLTDIHPILSLGAGLFIAGGIHAVKAVAVRPAISASTAGAANTPVSIMEDVVSTILSIVAVVLPILIACIFILVTSWIIFRMLRNNNQESAI
jgi:uncharacterized membrane protein